MTDERTVHRLEAFSDIVIGFCLAELGATLTFDQKTMTLDPVGVIAFFIAFAIICSLWFFHHRLFQGLFRPRTLPIVLNFLWLAVVVLLVLTAVQVPHGFLRRNFDMLYFVLYSQAMYMSYWTVVFVLSFALVAMVPQMAIAGPGLDVIFGLAGVGTPFIAVVLRRYKPVAVASHARRIRKRGHPSSGGLLRHRHRPRDCATGALVDDTRARHRPLPAYARLEHDRNVALTFLLVSSLWSCTIASFVISSFPGV